MLFFCLFGLSSCWLPCAPAIYGTVLDDNTDIPLDSVKIDFYEEGDFVQSIYTDSTGIFSFSAESEGVFITKKCSREFQLTFVKNGYIKQDFNDDAPSVGIKIKLKK